MKRLLDKLRFAWDLWRALRSPLPTPAEPAAPQPPTPRRLEGHLFIANCQYPPAECPWATSYLVTETWRPDVNNGNPVRRIECRTCHRHINVETEA